MERERMIFAAKPKTRFHLSVGAVIINEKNEVLCHHYQVGGKLNGVYTLMRETVENNESNEHAVLRGLQEEFGATGEILAYLGSITAKDKWFGEINQEKIVEKTTLYFLVKCNDVTPENALKDEQTGSTPEWKEIQFLIQQMQSLIEKVGIQDINESEILKRALEYINSNIKND